MIAHHAVPESNLTEAELRALEGPYRYLRDALGEVMPLKIEAYPENTTVRALFEIDGPGTIADDVIRKNLASILLGYDPIENLDVALGLAPAPSSSVDEGEEKEDGR